MGLELRQIAAQLHPEALKILLVLFLAFLIGLQREGWKGQAGHYFFGGVRTFPLIGLLGYTVALISSQQLLPIVVGLVVVGAFLLVSYLHKLATAGEAGVTTEMSGLLTYMLGVLVSTGHLWIATTVVVICLLLLELKEALEGLSHRIPPEEIATFTKFLLLTVVILPAVPNQEFTSFHINPFKTWLVVVAVSGISYASYVLQRATAKRGGVVLAALLGGAYSSTVMTVALARRAKRENHPNLFAGSMLLASGVMYLRVLGLLAIFSRPLLEALAPAVLVLGGTAIIGGLLWTRLPDHDGERPEREYEARNPLELGPAFAFAGIFVAMLVATQFVVRHLGAVGIFALAAITGATDVDPFVMGLTQTAGVGTPVAVAAAAVLVSTSANNVLKGVYALVFADRETGRRGLLALVLLGVAGVVSVLML